MKNFFMCICILIMVFMFVSCQSTKSVSSAPPAAPTGIQKTLNGKWSGNFNWDSGFRTGSTYRASVMVQEGTSVTMMNTSPAGLPKLYGSLEGNIIHVKNTNWINSEGISVYYPDRDFLISDDGNTITTNFVGTWSQAEGSAEGKLKVNGTMTRE